MLVTLGSSTGFPWRWVWSVGQAVCRL